MRPLFDCDKYMRSCCTRVKKPNQPAQLVHNVDGRLLRTIKSGFTSRRWYHVIRLADRDLFQRYMIVIDEDLPIEGTQKFVTKENTLNLFHVPFFLLINVILLKSYLGSWRILFPI